MLHIDITFPAGGLYIFQYEIYILEDFLSFSIFRVFDPLSKIFDNIRHSKYISTNCSLTCRILPPVLSV